ncbi:MAG TPA: phosphotransferase family protein [Thermoanaerobaculia bacterium]|nr:phosphotransferase family protein [Thermoanaerobaculia bacterium]
MTSTEHEPTVRGIDAPRVTAWIEAHVAGSRPPFRFELIPAGHSNMTFTVTDERGERYVLRRPPLGAVLATAHDMGREFKIISALGPTAVPVPPALGLCTDESVNGAPFYLMGFVDGHVLVETAHSEQHFSPAERRRVSESLIQVLADLHAVDPDAVGLGDLGRKEAYLARQIKRWRKQWESSKTRELEAMEVVAAALERHMPEQIGATVVHGDFRLGNCIAGYDARIAAVLDWELCTLGDPLADVGYILNDWVEPGEAPFGSLTRPGPSAAAGFLRRDQMLASYERLSGRTVHNVDYYRAFQYWRLAAIAEGVLARFLKGVMGKEADTDGMARRVESLADAALRIVRTLD